MTIQASGGGGIRLAPRRRDDSAVGILAPRAGVQQSQGTLPVASDPEASEFAASAAPRVVTAEDVNYLAMNNIGTPSLKNRRR